MLSRILAAFAVSLAFAAIALASVGCGGSDESSPSAPESEPTGAPTAAGRPAPEPTATPTASPTAATPSAVGTSCPPDNCPKSVVGTVEYPGDAPLPPDAVLEVALLDVSRADASAITISERTIANPGQSPISFELGYDPSAIDERLDYSVQASITQGDRLLFTNDTVYPVLTYGFGERVNMVLVRVQP